MPKYIDIAGDIRNKIHNETYKTGSQIPPEYVLCGEYDCNRETMKKALKILVDEGLIVRRRGAGTFVMNHASKEKITSLSVTKNFPDQKVTSDVVVFEVIRSDARVADKLGIDKGTFVYHIIRNRSLSDTPYCVSESYLPVAMFPDLRKDVLYGSLYNYCEKTLKLKVQSSNISITSPLATKNDAFLGLNEFDGLVQIESIAHMNDGRTFEYAIIRMHPFSFRYEDCVILA